MSIETSQRYSVLAATAIVSAVLGSIHSFSVFLNPLETKYEVTRAIASLTYSLALVMLTAAVLLGPYLYNRFSPATIFIAVGLLGFTGTILAGLADNIVLVWLGYSVIFGFSNGLGYGFGLQFAARANPDISGFAMGVVTAAYALGAVIAPYGFEVALTAGGFLSAMLMLSVLVLLAGLIAAAIAAKSRMRYSTTQASLDSSVLPVSRIALIWVSYCASVFAGLMVIGHAAGLAAAAGFTSWKAVVVLASFNLVGSLLAGWLVDRTSHQVILTSLALVSVFSVVALIVFPTLTLASLAFVGFAYGGTIAAYPAAISQQFPGDGGPRVYGRVFTAWGVAGLLAPWTAGMIFDLTGGYQAALWTASALALLSALVTTKFINADRELRS